MLPESPWNPHPGPTSAQVIRDIFRELIKYDERKYQGEFVPGVLDLTYGNGTFWNWPGAPRVHHSPGFDFRLVPVGGRSYEVVVFDPPFSSMGTASDGANMSDRYGADRNNGGPKDYDEVAALLTGGIAEATRIAREWVIVKTQDVVERSQLHSSITLAINRITNSDFDIVREIAFMPPRRPQPGNRRDTGRGNRPSWFIVARRNK